MIRHRVLTSLTALGLLLDSPMALATDPVGLWVVDQDALRGELDRAMQEEAAKMSAAERAQFEPSMTALLDQIAGQYAGTIEFHQDGTVSAIDHTGKRTSGAWTQDGDIVRLDMENDPPYAGPFEGDTMRLNPEDEAEPGLEIILNRR